MRTVKNAEKIKRRKSIKDPDSDKTMIQTLMEKQIKKNIIPRSLGMINLKGENHSRTITLNKQPLKGAQASAFSKALQQAKFVEKIDLNETGLADVGGIKIITRMNPRMIKTLVFSNNLNLTSKFYD